MLMWDAEGNPAGDQVRALLLAHGIRTAVLTDEES